MKLLVLAAGYAMRLYPLTRDKAKPLLPVAGRPMIEHILDRFRGVVGLDTVFVATNKRFAADFEAWARTYQARHPFPVLRLINDGSTCNEDRLGAIGDLDLVLRTQNVAEDLVLVAGDNLFTESLEGFWKTACRRTTIATYDVKNLQEVRAKYNSLVTDAEGRVISFVEKDPAATSTVTAICLYYLPRETLPLVARYLKENPNATDYPGHYIQWLHRQIPVYTYRLGGLWWDIGSHETYREVNEWFALNRKESPT